MSTADDLAPGWLLVATPQLRDPNFRRAVVYLISHSEEGSAGIILNHRSDTAVHTVLPEWGPHTSLPPLLYIGGPVQTDAALAMGVLRPGVDASSVESVEQVAGSVVMVNVDAGPDVLMPHLEGVRMYAGHAGWGPNQVAEEIAEGAWQVLPSRSNDVLAGPLTDVWFRVLKRQGWPRALDAYHPGDLRRN